MNTNSQNVLDEPNNNTIFMVWNFKEGAENIKDTFSDICRLVTNLNNTANTRFPEAKASIVMGIGFEAWDMLELPYPLPKEFEKFQEIKGDKHTAVSTRGDLHFHVRSDNSSYCIDMATHISDILIKTMDCVEEIHGFRYWDGRSILGFVDGTENPRGEEERSFFGMIGNEDEVYKGGSYLFVQKYIHDMKAWRELPVNEQEKVIGRSKTDDIEMPEDIKPSNSHAALSNVGDDLKVIRDNMPFGSVASNQMGTYFIAYASSFKTVKKMLTKMFIGEPKGNYDRILDFSTPKTGTLFFVPTFDMLDEFAE